IRVRVPLSAGVDAAYLRVVEDAEPRYVPATGSGHLDGEDWYTAEITVHNPVTQYRVLLDRGPAGYTWLNGTGEYAREVSDRHDFRLTTYDPGPDWGPDSVVYQIFPDRFARSGVDRGLPDWAIAANWDDPVVHRGPDTPRQFYGGDLDGITEHLDHVTDLGATAIYLTPIFPARSNHRYNATSFDAVDPLLGGDEALARLSSAAHARGLHLIGDLTTNHSGNDHAWFTAAMAGGPERGYYYFDERGGYASWLGHPTLPKFNLGSAELREQLFGHGDSVVARWLRPPFDLDGWRIDVANMTGRYGPFDHGLDVARELRGTLDAVRPGSALLAEHCHDFSADLIGDGWQGAMNYAGFTRPVWSWLTATDNGLGFLGMPQRIPRRTGRDTIATMRDFLASTPWKVALRHWNLLASHDTPRFRTVTGDPVGVRLGVALQMTYPGAPMIFAGEELGLEAVDGEHARTPMPWARPETWDGGTLATFRALIAIRRAHPALRTGGLRWVIGTDDAVGYLRETGDERLLVVVARGPWSGAVLPGGLAAEPPQTLYGGVDLVASVRALIVPGEGPCAGIWRLA
ncbi:MAG TPA: glycoside hydrolase family 13 protein, partial [Candidatus Nanopelagicales bacterium]|nr:glycoside hydrolase family 13 protein [Candidatus Nanopelagicales bacterium]